MTLDSSNRPATFEGVQPLTLSLSLWERGPLHNVCDIVPSPMGRGTG